MEMHTLLSSALESSTKNSDKLNTLKVKLVDSENLVAVLTQKVNYFFFFKNLFRYTVKYVLLKIVLFYTEFWQNYRIRKN